MTRPEFLSTLICDSGFHPRSMTEVKAVLPEHYDVIYCAYSAIVEADIGLEDIRYVSLTDEEDIVIKASDKATAKRIAGSCNKETVRLGEKIYALSIKAKDKHVIVKITLTNPAVLTHTIIGTYLEED